MAGTKSHDLFDFILGVVCSFDELVRLSIKGGLQPHRSCRSAEYNSLEHLLISV